MKCWSKRETRGLTLIELLLVVSLIATLAMLAVPNFLHAQIRSKVSRTKSDLRTLSVGVELYRVDNNVFPDSESEIRFKAGMEWSKACLNRMTTPIAYLSALSLDDTFSRQSPAALVYVNTRAQTEQVPSVVDLLVPGLTRQQKAELARSEYMLAGVGPDGLFHSQVVGDASVIRGLLTKTDFSSNYDPTNGTVSPGDISRTAFGAR